MYFQSWVIVKKNLKTTDMEGRVWSGMTVLLARGHDTSICFDPTWPKGSTFPPQLPHWTCFFLLKEGEMDFEKEAATHVGISQELRGIMGSFHLESHVEGEWAAWPREMSMGFKVRSRFKSQCYHTLNPWPGENTVSLCFFMCQLCNLLWGLNEVIHMMLVEHCLTNSTCYYYKLLLFSISSKHHIFSCFSISKIRMCLAIENNPSFNWPHFFKSYNR